MYQSKLNDENYRYKALKMKAKYTWNKKQCTVTVRAIQDEIHSNHCSFKTKLPDW